MTIMNLRYLLPLLAAAAFSLAAQQHTVFEFDVAAIKHNKMGGKRSGFDSTPGLWKADNVTVKSVIMNAYEVLTDQISGAPSWLDSERFDIEAKFEQDPGTSKQDESKEARLRLQALLASRFQFQMHRETREWQAYVLVKGKKGPKLTPTKRSEGSSMHSNNGHLECNGVSMENLARGLAGRLGRPVVNETGLEGRFDFTLDFEPDAPVRAADKDNLAGGVDANRPSMFTALQDQLGLKLESRKANVEFLVVDRVERPSGN